MSSAEPETGLPERTGYTLQRYVELGSSSGVRELTVTMDGREVVIRGIAAFSETRRRVKSAAEAWLKENGLERSVRVELQGGRF